MSQTDIFRLDDQVAVVPGGSGGIGSRLCRALADVGASVAVIGRTAASAQEVVDAIETSGGSALQVTADVTVRAEAERAIAVTKERFGRIDIINAVSGGAGNVRTRPTSIQATIGTGYSTPTSQRPVAHAGSRQGDSLRTSLSSMSAASCRCFLVARDAASGSPSRSASRISR